MTPARSEAERKTMRSALFAVLLASPAFAYDPSLAQRRDHAAYVAGFMGEAAYNVRVCMGGQVREVMRYGSAKREAAVGAALGCAESYIVNAVAYGYRTKGQARAEAMSWAETAYQDELRRGR